MNYSITVFEIVVMELKSCAEENDKKWRGETCKKVLKLNKIISGFKDHPVVPKEACEAYYDITENQKMIRYNYQVLDILNEAEKHRVQLSEVSLYRKLFCEHFVF